MPPPPAKMSFSPQEMEMRSMMKVQFSMIKNCFQDCVQGFGESNLTSREQSCLQNCARREFAQMQTFGALQNQLMSKMGGGGGPQF